MHVSLLNQDTIRKEQVNKLLDINLKLDTRDNKEYKVETICDGENYAKKAVGQLP